MSATSIPAVALCCVFAPTVSPCPLAVAMAPVAWKLPLVGLELLLIVAMGVLLGEAVRRTTSNRED